MTARLTPRWAARRYCVAASGDDGPRRERDLLGHRFVVSANGSKQHDQQRDQDDDDPGPVRKFRARDNQRGDPGGDGADTVDEQFLLPMRSFLHQPTFHHAGLRNGEGEEHAYRIERNECVGIAVEEDDQQAGKDAEDDDAV